MKNRGYILVQLVCIGVLISWGTPNFKVRYGNELSNGDVKVDSVRIEYLAHASFKVSYKGNTLLLDPFADKIWIGYNFPKNVTADAVFSTHPHYDHDGGIYLGKTPYWEHKIPFYTDPGIYQIGDIKVRGIVGKHCDPYGKEFDQKNTIWIVTMGDFTLVHLGDNGPLTAANFEAIALEKNIDVLMVAIDSQYHILKPNELQETIQGISPGIIIPMHYRIPELEVTEDAPKDLGNLDPYLEGRPNVTRIKGNSVQLPMQGRDGLQRYLVLEHSPEVTK